MLQHNENKVHISNVNKSSFVILFTKVFFEIIPDQSLQTVNVNET